MGDAMAEANDTDPESAIDELMDMPPPRLPHEAGLAALRLKLRRGSA
jgi:hypothetical protein